MSDDKVVEQIKNAETEVSALKKKLDELNEQKEAWFAKKAEIGNTIKDKINVIKDLKAERNSLTNQVRDLKKKRDQLNKEIASKIKSISNVKKPDFKGKKGVSPGRVKKEIEELEYKMMTSPMKLEAEQKLMKRVKELKKELAEFDLIRSENETYFKASKETDSLKKEANKLHGDLKSKAEESQKIHESLVQESKAVDQLKVEEEDAYNKFFNFKKEFTELNETLKNILKNMKDSQKKTKADKKTAARRSDEKLMEEKTKSVEEKLEKKKKLTTEDLLILQRSNK